MNYEFTFYIANGGELKKTVWVDHVKSNRVPVIDAMAADMKALELAGFEVTGASYYTVT